MTISNLQIFVKLGIDFGIFSEDERGKKFRAALEYTITYGIAIRGFILPFSKLLYNIIGTYTGLLAYCDMMSNVLDEVIEKRRREIKERESHSVELDRGEIPCDILSLLVEANLQEGLLTDGDLKSNAFIFA